MKRPSSRGLDDGALERRRGCGPRVGIPERFARATLEGFDPSVSPAAANALALARRAVDPEAPDYLASLTLIGRPGAGKSHLAAAICNAYADLSARREDERPDEIVERIAWWHAHEPRWANVADLLIRLRAEFSTGERLAHDLVDELATRRGPVVLDDVGRGKASDWSAELIYNVVNRRYEALRPTIVTSNVTVAEFGEMGLSAVLSRLAEDGAILEMTSAIDYRLRRTAA